MYIFRFARASFQIMLALKFRAGTGTPLRRSSPLLFRKRWIMSFLRRSGNFVLRAAQRAPRSAHARMASFLLHLMLDNHFCTD
jgi:hypothetical protein